MDWSGQQKNTAPTMEGGGVMGGRRREGGYGDGGKGMRGRDEEDIEGEGGEEGL